MESIHFRTADGIRLEGILHYMGNAPAAVITHPHPLYGGDMHNHVVGAIEAAFRDTGFTTLRFNFRGTGGSGGTYDEGIGESRDVLAALGYVQGLGAARIDLAGYSFGAWVNAMAAGEADIARLILVSPPVAMLPFAERKLPALKLVVTGSGDEYAPPDRIRERLTTWNPEAVLEIIEGGDHFYGEKLARLRTLLITHLQ